VTALAVAPQRRHRGPLAHLNSRLGGDHRGELGGDLVAGRAAAGVDYAAAGVASLEAERELAVGLEVEDDPARAQLGDGGGCLVDQDLDRRGAAEPASGGDRVGRVLGR
jgi:hypothetical protein